jgi:hypothetical protein
LKLIGKAFWSRARVFLSANHWRGLLLLQPEINSTDQWLFNKPKNLLLIHKNQKVWCREKQEKFQRYPKFKATFAKFMAESFYSRARRVHWCITGYVTVFASRYWVNWPKTTNVAEPSIARPIYQLQNNKIKLPIEACNEKQGKTPQTSRRTAQTC